ncbi:MAG TPA: zinc ribbon domain-containing protein [Thermoanaerobaculia bacterium]|nr:zinc ribbon domain-containing protein [Thermoanaerobaculia bacterium]HUM28721.1 zinc ribbon domain-containing protein [Thermoanaerobaculia bacterium]
MPIYEFYCSPCHRIFQFFSTVPNTETVPDCPRCGKSTLSRRVSRFATLKHREDDEPSPFGDMDEERMEGAMETLAGEMGSMEDMEDPRAAAKFMRKFMDMTGMEMGPRMEEMVRRLESGENPDALEEEFGDVMDEEDDDALSEFIRMKKYAMSKRKAPSRDETLYFLD